MQDEASLLWRIKKGRQSHYGWAQRGREKEQELQVLLEQSHKSTPVKWQDIEGKWLQEWLEELNSKNYILKTNEITKGRGREKYKD